MIAKALFLCPFQTLDALSANHSHWSELSWLFVQTKNSVYLLAAVVLANEYKIIRKGAQMCRLHTLAIWDHVPV